jgi:hypothetical protein
MTDASLKALNAAKALVKDIEFFRTHGTGVPNTQIIGPEMAIRGLCDAHAR